VIGEGVAVAAIAAGAALAGSALSYWGALRLQAMQDARADALARGALRRDQRAACLGWVLEARTRMEALMPRLTDPEWPFPPAEALPGVAARRAYAAALLYLADARPCAKAFYQSTVSAQRALETPSADNVDAVVRAVEAWRQSCEEMEKILADMQDLV
jgi:hypothetical protein